MRKFFEDALKMPYFSGDYRVSDHETAIEQLLITHGFTSSNVANISKKELKQLMKQIDVVDMKNGEYISQPCGKNSHPDFIVKYNNVYYFIECKSSKGHYPMYNSAAPKAEFIYIFTSAKYNQTTIYFGIDILAGPEYMAAFRAYEKELALLNRKFQELECIKNHPRGFTVYDRIMHIQQGGKKKIDYFTHNDRSKCEANVLNSFQ